MRKGTFVLMTAAICAPAGTAMAATYQVGPSRSLTSLQQVEAILQPGDVVEVDGDATYPGDIHIRPSSAGTESQKIVIRGVIVNGKRPVISGGQSYGIVLHGNHTVFENFEVTGSQGACIIDKAHDLTLRNLHVHDCPGQGILGMDNDAGDQTIEFSEIDHCGSELYDHQIYLANDETLYPNARMRVQFNWIHDGNGGNDLKSRASRNEIYGNWIESPHYHILDLIGADGQDQWLAREDSDVVGNVLIQTSEYQIARIGGDGTGASQGRYRFAYNTIVASSSQSMLFRAIDEIESVAIHDNVFVLPNGGAPTLIDTSEAIWTSGSPQLAAQNNFVQAGIELPAFFTGSMQGADAGFVDALNGNFTPTAESPLVDGGSTGTGPSSYEVPNALSVPTFVPPARFVPQDLVPIARPTDGSPDIGAYEVASSVVDPGAGGAGAGGGSSNGGGPSGGDGSPDPIDEGHGGNGTGGDASGGGDGSLLDPNGPGGGFIGGCSATGQSPGTTTTGLGAAALALAMGLVARRRRRTA